MGKGAAFSGHRRNDNRGGKRIMVGIDLYQGKPRPFKYSTSDGNPNGKTLVKRTIKEIK